MSLEQIKKYSWHPLIFNWPKDYCIKDWSSSNLEKKDNLQQSRYSVGKYNESRSIYTESYFLGRHIHMGVDLGAPSQTPLYAVSDGEIVSIKDHNQFQDYGPTVILKISKISSDPLYILYGHLSRQSLLNKKKGDFIFKGDLLGWIGEEDENGGWPPHVHFQLSWIPPKNDQFPGVVSSENHQQALKDFPDPLIILGPLY